MNTIINKKEFLKIRLCLGRLYLMAGFQAFPSFVYRKYNHQKEKFEKIPVFGSNWHAPHDWKTFIERASVLNSYEWVAKKGGFNSIWIVCGYASGVTVLDVDKHIGIDQTYLESLIPTNTPYEITPSGGKHFFFKYDPDCLSQHISSLDCDILNDGKPCIISPSMVDGVSVPYHWVNNLPWPAGWLDKAMTQGFEPIPDPSAMMLPTIPPMLKGFLCGVKRVEIKKEKDPSKKFDKIPLDRIEEMLGRIIAINGQPAHDDWMKIISAIWSQHTYEESISIINRYMPEDKPGLYHYKYEHRIEKNITMGTLVHWYQESLKKELII